MSQMKQSAAPKGASVSKGAKARKANNNNKLVNNSRSMSAAPVAISANYRYSRPQFRNLSGGDISISHEERFADVYQTADGLFYVTGYAINPGNPALFPWLSVLATRWETYEFQKFNVCYYQNCPSSTPGDIVISPDYNASDSVPASMIQMSSYVDSAESSVWSPCMMVSSPKNLLTARKRYIRAEGQNPVGTDIRLSDTGNVFIGIEGDPTSGSPERRGFLVVKYTVSMFTPELNTTNLGLLEGGMLATAPSAFNTYPLTGDVAISANMPFGISQILSSGEPSIDPQSVGFTYNVSDTVSTLVIANPGTYLFEADITGMDDNAEEVTPKLINYGFSSGASLEALSELAGSPTGSLTDRFVSAAWELTTTAANQLFNWIISPSTGVTFANGVGEFFLSVIPSALSVLAASNVIRKHARLASVSKGRFTHTILTKKHLSPPLTIRIPFFRSLDDRLLRDEKMKCLLAYRDKLRKKPISIDSLIRFEEVTNAVHLDEDWGCTNDVKEISPLPSIVPPLIRQDAGVRPRSLSCITTKTN